MVHRLLVTIALACCALVVASFAMFARDQIAGASKHQQNELAAGAPVTTGNSAPPKHNGHAQPRHFIDAAASKLVSPFRSFVHSSSEWVNQGLPTLAALLVYGVGLGYLARFSRGLS